MQHKPVKASAAEFVPLDLHGETLPSERQFVIVGKIHPGSVSYRCPNLRGEHHLVFQFIIVLVLLLCVRGQNVTPEKIDLSAAVLATSGVSVILEFFLPGTTVVKRRAEHAVEIRMFAEDLVLTDGAQRAAHGFRVHVDMVLISH